MKKRLIFIILLFLLFDKFYANEKNKLKTTEFKWEFEGNKWKVTSIFSIKMYEFYKKRTRYRDYELFASDNFDDTFIKDIVKTIEDGCKKHRLPKEKIPYLLINFVQSLPYTVDSVTSGYDEYPRFPYETLYDGGGDCEDTSILIAAILIEMGYDVVLIKFPNHMGIGIYSKSASGYFVKYKNRNYYYLETTGLNWKIGEVPKEYNKLNAELIPIYKRPSVYINFKCKYRYCNFKDVYVDADINVTNTGSLITNDTLIYIALQTTDLEKVWDQHLSKKLSLKPEETLIYKVKNLKAPFGKKFRIIVKAVSKEYNSNLFKTDWIITNK